MSGTPGLGQQTSREGPTCCSQEEGGAAHVTKHWTRSEGAGSGRVLTRARHLSPITRNENTVELPLT
jgi:hypothetical protein